MHTSTANHHSLHIGRRFTVLCCIISLVILPLQSVMAYQTSIEYYHHNHQGSLLEVYDGATNKRLLSQAWSPWGERQILHSAASGNGNNERSLLSRGLPAHMGYTGHKRLLATGLDFAGDTRLYDARLKRFLNSDDRTTGGVRGQNRYSYAYNNPMTYIDPDGRSPISWLRRFFRRRPSPTVTGQAIEVAHAASSSFIEEVAHAASSSFIEAVRLTRALRLTVNRLPEELLAFKALSVMTEHLALANEQAARNIIGRQISAFRSRHNYYLLTYKLNLRRVGVLPEVIANFGRMTSVTAITRFNVPGEILYLRNAVFSYIQAKRRLNEHKAFVDEHRANNTPVPHAGFQNAFRYALADYYMKQMTWRVMQRQYPEDLGLFFEVASDEEEREAILSVVTNQHPFAEDELVGFSELGYSIVYDEDDPHEWLPRFNYFFDPNNNHTVELLSYPVAD